MISVSLVLATYGRCEDLGRMLESLAAQTDRAFEVLIVDQNPDDRLLEHIQHGLAAGLTIRHLRMERPSLSGARNLGIAEANGDVIGFPDDDCWYEPTTIANLRNAFESTAGVDGLVGCWVEQTQASGKGSPSGPLSYEDWRRFRGGSASSITLFLHRSLLNRLGGFDERFGVGQWYGVGEETDLILRGLSIGAQLEYCSAIRVHHAFTSGACSPLLTCCLDMRKRGRGTGGIYAKHHMSTWVILRGLAGQVLRPLLRGNLIHSFTGFSASLGALEGYVRWRLFEQGRKTRKPA